MQLPKSSIPNKIKWNESTEEDIKRYKQYIESELLKLRFDREAITCKDVNCKKHSEYVNYL